MFRILGAQVKQNIVTLQNIFLAQRFVGRVGFMRRVLEHRALQRLHLQQLPGVVLLWFLGLRPGRKQENRNCQVNFHESSRPRRVESWSATSDVAVILLRNGLKRGR